MRNNAGIINKLKSGISAILISALIIIPSIVKSDTLILNNGTFLVGKVKSDSPDAVVFKNSYGAFRIRKNEITKLFVTKSYKEDIAVRKKLGMDFNEEDIKSNYSAGQKDLTEEEVTLLINDETEPTEIPTDGKVFLEGAGLVSIGELNDVIPYGYGGYIGLEAGESYLDNSARNITVPWLRVEAGYIKFRKDDASLSGFTACAGPLWIFPVTENCCNNIRLSIEPAISWFKIVKGSANASTCTFTYHSILGYEFSFDSVFLFINLRYMYVYDKVVFYNSAGVTAGVSGRLW